VGGQVSTRYEVDELGRRIIMALQQDGRADWTSIASLCGTSKPTVARRVERLMADGVLKVAVMPELGSDGPVDIFLASIGCRPGTQIAVVERLVARPDVRFAALVAGSHDIVIELVVGAGPTGYPEAMLQIQTIPGVVRWHCDLVLHVYKMSQDWNHAPSGTGPARATTNRSVELTPCAPDHLDHVDRAILDRLRIDGRASFKALAAAMGVNESTVRRRFERMVANRCATVITIVPPAAVGLRAVALLTISVEPGKLNEVADVLGRHRSVRYLAATLTGSSLVCEVIATSTQGLFEFSTSTLATLDGVVNWTASLELLTVKRAFIETPWWRAQSTDSTARPAMADCP
jgi:DNA-binding Lrp family transcriptional regulator